jgi:membrane associated rhomboid family serine protease
VSRLAPPSCCYRHVSPLHNPHHQALASFLVATYVYAALFPGGAADVLALQPDKVVPRLWSLVTSSFYEWNAVSLLTHVGVVFTLGQRLERVWGAPEFLRFVLLVNACVGTATFVSMYALYIATRDQYYLFTRCLLYTSPSPRD